MSGATAGEMRAGQWVRFPRIRDKWVWVIAARHGDGFVQYDAAARENGPCFLGGFATSGEPMLIAIEPWEVAA